MAKIILDLCGGTGAWSKPYRDAGYDVRNITLPDTDVRIYEPPDNVYGILAAPPCTHFSGSGAMWWKAKDKDGRTLEDLTITTACLTIILKMRPKFCAKGGDNVVHTIVLCTAVSIVPRGGHEGEEEDDEEEGAHVSRHLSAYSP